MSVKNKLLISVLVIIGTMVALPLVTIHITDSWTALGYLLLFLIVVNPVVAVALGVFNGTSLRKLWFIPLVILAVFPLLYWVILKEVILELCIYSLGYAVLNLCAMIITNAVVKKIKAKKKKK